jgi:hypothetical protein
MGSKSYSKGISWIDDCRIPFVDTIDLEQTTHQKTKGDKYGNGKGFHKEPIIMQMYKPQGRFPANLLVSDDMLNDGVISKSQENKSKGNIRKSLINGAENAGGFYRPDYFVQRNGFNDKGTNSRYYDIDCWFNNLIDV